VVVVVGDRIGGEVTLPDWSNGVCLSVRNRQTADRWQTDGRTNCYRMDCQTDGLTDWPGKESKADIQTDR